jgi:small subunit ribosomal protein S6
MNFYEIAYLISTKIDPEKIKEVQKEIIGILRKHEGEIEEEVPPLKRSLAYPIKKEREAFLVSLTFWMPASKIKECKKEIEKTEGILRYLIVKKNPPKKVVEAEKKKPTKKPEKVELEKLEEKLEEILGTKL